LSSEEEESDLCNIISDMLRFLRIGFLLRKEFDLEIRLLLEGEVAGILKDLSVPVCSGPYSHVTSQSFNLVAC